MCPPPGSEYCLKGCNQVLKRDQGQNGRLGTQLRGEAGADHRNEAELTRQDFHLTVSDVARQPSDAQKLKFPAEKRVRGIGDDDLAFTFLGDERGTSLVEVCRLREAQTSTRFHRVR